MGHTKKEFRIFIDKSYFVGIDNKTFRSTT